MMRGSKSEDEMTAEIIANAESICRSSLFLFLYHQQYLVEEHLSSLVFVRPGAELDCIESFISTPFYVTAVQCSHDECRRFSGRKKIAFP